MMELSKSNKLKYFQDQYYKSDFIHINNAGLQPTCKPAKDRAIYWANRFYEEGYYADQDYLDELELVRKKLASFIGCESGEVSFYTSTAGAVNQVAFSIGLKKDDEVLMWDQEYGSHIYPWQAACDQAGAKLVQVISEKNYATPTDKFLAAITSKTKVIAFSWIQYVCGARMDDIQQLIQIAHEKNILVFVDVIQGMGLHPCDLWKWGVDGIMGGSHKWLLSPIGVGYLALKSELVAKVKPHNIGTYTYGTCDDPSNMVCVPKKDSAKYEPGSKQVFQITALGAAIDLIMQTTVEVIESESLRLAKKLRLGLIDQGYKILTPFVGEKMHTSPFINMNMGTRTETFDQLKEKLKQNKINFAPRGGGIRFTPQAFNTDTEIEKVLTVLK